MPEQELDFSKVEYAGGGKYSVSIVNGGAVSLTTSEICQRAAAQIRELKGKLDIIIREGFLLTDADADLRYLKLKEEKETAFRLLGSALIQLQKFQGVLALELSTRADACDALRRLFGSIFP